MYCDSLIGRVRYWKNSSSAVSSSGKKPVVDDRLRFDGTVGQTVQTNTGQRIGRFSVEAAQLFGGFYHLLIGRSALGGDFGSIEGQLQIDSAPSRARLPAEGVCR